ncbi:hypothetical protein [Riemerella columbina]|uniref:hypothetical protein n=1 Tax=Riemerella columbina TaxID=103810 RepID=UPI0003660CCE|nr:hypothetical protein [Riemerella columbina]
MKNVDLDKMMVGFRKHLKDIEKGKDMTPEEFIEKLKNEPKTVYFQPKGIKPIYCEAGIIYPDQPDYIFYLYEPCKVLKSEVKIIDRDNVRVCRKSRSFLVKKIK